MFDHITVLKQELVEMTLTTGCQVAVDATAGGGGHTQLLLDRVKDGVVIAFDRDQRACEHLSARFSEEIKAGSLILIHDAFSTMKEHLEKLHFWGKVDTLIADLGVSSPQIDEAERGFSFHHDGPLDMRMDRRIEKTAADVVNTYGERELCSIFREFGEEKMAFPIAKKIVKKAQLAPFETTLDLAGFISDNIGYRTKSKKHPATKIFQALRIYVNKELSQVKYLSEDGFSGLSKGGRLGVITFHSLEDRIIKHAFKEYQSPKNPLPKGVPLTSMEVEKRVLKRGKIIKPFPMLPSEKETAHNKRARSAKLRVIEKL